ncbi:MAG TPA: hypothetical protein VL989_01760 [Candidatus Sulfotelmatobacter sp.]|nr:hypothetical protein [Candidatus Sulfotelmatobacter sp.]
MYFASRMQAGRMLASRLQDKYRYENCVVLAVDDGGVVVGAQIAVQLHCAITLLNTKEIKLPMEPLAIAGVATGGAFTYNNKYSQGELDDMVSENRVYIEEERFRSVGELNRVVSSTGTVSKNLLRGNNVIVVSEGLKSPFIIDLVYEFLKPINIEKLVFALPIANVQVVDTMHILGDEIYCLDVFEDFLDVDHYYDKNDVPSHEKVIKIIEQVILNWR